MVPICRASIFSWNSIHARECAIALGFLGSPLKRFLGLQSVFPATAPKDRFGIEWDIINGEVDEEATLRHLVSYFRYCLELEVMCRYRLVPIKPTDLRLSFPR